MKRVIVFKHQRTTIPNKFHYDKVEDGTAIFHKFGSDYEEFDSGFGSYSVAIIEREDGKIEMPRADMIQFIKQEAAK